jgi:hypothetical protein
VATPEVGVADPWGAEARGYQQRLMTCLQVSPCTPMRHADIPRCECVSYSSLNLLSWMLHGNKSGIACFTQLKIYVDTSTHTNLNLQINYTILPATNNYYVNEYNSGQRYMFKQTHTRCWPGPLDGPAGLLLLLQSHTQHCLALLAWPTTPTCMVCP